MKKKKVCCILGAGDYFGDEAVPQESFVIAADGGLTQCRRIGITPDIIIGDFDSLGQVQQGENVIRLPVVKDDTDTIAAVKCALERGYQTFWLFGCTGGRLSHTLANLQTLTFIAKRGGIGFLVDKEEIATVTCKGLHFDKTAKGYVSVFAAEECVTLSESGLKYAISEQTLTADFPLGVSNEFLGEEARITVHSGSALIIFSKSERDKLLWE